MDRITGQVMSRAAARAHEDGGRMVFPDQVLLAVAELPSPARDVLVEAGLTPERLVQAMAERDAEATGRWKREWPGTDPADPPAGSGEGRVAMGPGVDRLLGWVSGYAAAGPGGAAAHEHWLLALIYLEPEGLGEVLDRTGGSAAELVAALRRRGVRVPEAEPPRHRPWQGRHHLDIPTTELTPLLRLLAARHPPGARLRWGFTAWPDDPSRSRVYAEEGIDLENLAAVARGRAGRNGPCG